MLCNLVTLLMIVKGSLFVCFFLEYISVESIIQNKNSMLFRSFNLRVL